MALADEVDLCAQAAAGASKRLADGSGRTWSPFFLAPAKFW